MERRSAESDDLLHVARGTAADIFIRYRSGTAFRKKLRAGTRANSFRSSHRRPGEPALGRSGVEQGDRERVESRNEIAVADDAGIGRALSRSRLAYFPASTRDVVCVAGLSAAIPSRGDGRVAASPHNF